MFISKNIKYLRDKEGLSQSVFAELFKLNRGNIASYEAGSEPPLLIIVAIANYFNISIDTLILSELSAYAAINKKSGQTEQQNPKAPQSAILEIDQKHCLSCVNKEVLIGSLRETIEAQKNDLQSKDVTINAFQEALGQAKARLEEHGLSASNRKAC